MLPRGLITYGAHWSLREAADNRPSIGVQMGRLGHACGCVSDIVGYRGALETVPRPSPEL